MSAAIVRVWGTADSIDLVFTHVSGNDWAVNVPPDLSDGQYACQIFAENSAGEWCMWTGILYMHCGIACLHITPERFTIWRLPDRSNLTELPCTCIAELELGRQLAEIVLECKLRMQPERTSLIYIGCCPVRRRLVYLPERVEITETNVSMSLAPMLLLCLDAGDHGRDLRAADGKRSLAPTEERINITYMGCCKHETYRNR